MNGFPPGHVFTPPQGGPSVQQPQRATVTATPVSGVDLRALASLPTPPSGYVFVVTRITLAASVVARSAALPHKDVAVPGGVVGRAQLRLNGLVIDTSDDGSTDVWDGQIIVAPNSLLDILWTDLLIGGDWDNAATATFEYLQATA